MKVLRIGFLGIRTSNFQQTVDFFQDVLGLPNAWAKPDWTGLKLPTGMNDFVEVFGPTKQDPNLYPESAGGIMVAFIVDDIVSAYNESAASGIELLGDIFWAAEGFGWFFLRAPDGNIYCVEQVPD